jgi:hypothetical protein
MSTWVWNSQERFSSDILVDIDSLETGSCQLQLWQLSWRSWWSWSSWQFLRPRDWNRGVIVQLTVWKLGVVSCNFGNSVGKVGQVGQVGSFWCPGMEIEEWLSVDSLKTGSCQLQLRQLSWRSWWSWWNWQFLMPLDGKKRSDCQLTNWKLGGDSLKTGSCQSGNWELPVGKVEPGRS